jgi:hypothetical protein
LDELIVVERNEDVGNDLWVVSDWVQEKLIIWSEDWSGVKMRKVRAVKNFK